MGGEKGSINKWERLVNQERVGQVRESQSAKGPGLSFELKWWHESLTHIKNAYVF